MVLEADILQFLKDLEKNNDRDWFNNNKDRYQNNHSTIAQFAENLLHKLNEHDVIETPSGKKSLFRIYRDVRFSPDKTPYNTHWSGGFKRATKFRRGGYYFKIKPGNNSFVGGGFWGPNKEDLLRIREAIAADHDEMRDLVTDKNFVDTFGGLQGEQLKTAPKGFDKEHPGIDLLRYKQFIFGKNFTDKEVLEKDFINKVDETFMVMRPFFDYMSDVLTTDANGVPLYEE